jgi:hypothetical protein
VNPADGPNVQTPSTGQCLLSAGNGTCYAYLFGVKATSGYDATKPFVTLHSSATGFRSVDAPKTCYGVLATCP